MIHITHFKNGRNIVIFEDDVNCGNTNEMKIWPSQF